MTPTSRALTLAVRNLWAANDAVFMASRRKRYGAMKAQQRAKREYYEAQRQWAEEQRR